MCEYAGKADLLPDHIDSKQSRKSFDLSLTFHQSNNFITFSFRPIEVRRLLSELNFYGGTDPLGMFLLFVKITADDLSASLSVVFHMLFHLGVSQLA